MDERKIRESIMTLIRIVFENHSLTAQEIATMMNISDRTVRKRIDDANNYLKENNLGMIEAKPKIGIVLYANYDQRQRLDKMIGNGILAEEKVNDQSRIFKALRFILRSVKQEPTSIKEISNELFLSEPTTAKVIKECEVWLSVFNISLQTKKNLGLQIICSEDDYRRAVKEFVQMDREQRSAEENLNFFFPNLNVELVKNTLLKYEKDWNFNFTEASFTEILVYLCIATYENISKECTDQRFTKEKELQKYTEYQFAKKLFRKINERFGIDDNEYEIDYLTIQILCSQFISKDKQSLNDLIDEYDHIIDEFVRKTIDVVSNVINIDLKNDTNFYHGLLNHIRPLLFRLKYGQSLDTTITANVRENFMDTLRVSWLISTLFEQYFNMSINDDELSYIALYIQSAIDSAKTTLKTILVTDQTMSVAKLLTGRIIGSLRDIEEIKIVSVHEYKKQEYKDAELILTTVDIGDDDRVYKLTNLFSDENIDNIRIRIKNSKAKKDSNKFSFDPIVHAMFEPDLMITNIEAKNKNEVIKMLCEKLLAKGYVSKKYYESVLLRESASDTSIGIGVAIPHGNMNYTNQSKIAIATLKNPIEWNDEKVTVIFLLAIIISDENEIERWQSFYRQFIKLTDNEDTLHKIKGFTNEANLYYYLIQ